MTSTKDAKKVSQSFPPGWNEAKVRAVLEHYDHLTDEERAREIEESVELEDQTTMSVPTELVPAIARLIAEHQSKTANGRAHQRRSPKKASGRQRKPTQR